MLLGTKGPCIISHGSSSDEAMVNAISIAAEMVQGELVGKIADAVK